MQEQQTMGGDYLESYEFWSREPGRQEPDIDYAANQLGLFLKAAALHAEAETLLRESLKIGERIYAENESRISALRLGIRLNNLASILQDSGRLNEAETLYRRALSLLSKKSGDNSDEVAITLSSLASLLLATGRLDEAENLFRRAVAMEEQITEQPRARMVIRYTDLLQFRKNSCVIIDR